MKKECSFCSSWEPHFQYGFMGFCLLIEKIVFEDEFCELFEFKKLEKDFIWCSTCKSEIYAEEVKDHKSRGHKLFSRIFIDEDYREEIYEG